MQRRHPNRPRDLRESANWQERNERAYWGSGEQDLPHYDDMLLPDDEREIDLHARGSHGAPSYARRQVAPAPHAHPARNAERNAPRVRGPKGYTRSDERIREDVCERLAYAVDIDVSEVTVAVETACVLLEGTVPERWMKHEIEDLAASCVWVDDVENRVRVTRGVRADDPARASAAAPVPSSGASDPAARPSGAIGPDAAAESGIERGIERDVGATGPDARRH